MIASLLSLTRSDIKSLKITDTYSLHRIIYDLFEDIRTEQQKKCGEQSGFLYVDKGGDWNHRKILLLSNREPKTPEHGQLISKKIDESFINYDWYQFEITINPTKREKTTGKIIAIRERKQIIQWFIEKSHKSWGFSVESHNLQIINKGITSFNKKGNNVTLGYATLIGKLKVIDRDIFIKSFKQGIGRGRTFGFGLLQIVPIFNVK